MNIPLSRFLPFILFMGLAIFLWRGLSLEPQTLPSSQIGRSLPEFKVPVLGDPSRNFSSSELSGPLLLNVWASWCSACTEEQIFLMKIAKDIPVYGLNYKDTPESAMKWLEDWGNPYTLTGEDINGKAAMDLGVYGTPETFLIDASGVIRLRHAGILTEAVWKEKFLPELQSLRGRK